MNLDLTAAKVFTGRTLLPVGIYNMKITDTEVSETNSGGHALKVTFTVLDGEHEGKSIVEMLNIVNSNADAQRIALNSLKTILTVGGHANPNHLADSDEMLALNMRVSLDQKESTQMKDDGTPFINNVVKGYFKYEEGKASTSSNEAPAPQTAAAPTPAPTPAVETAAPAATPAADGAFPWS